MAYYNTPYNYNFGYIPQQVLPIAYPQQVFETPQQQMSQQTNNETSDSYFIWVQGESGAKAYPVARGTTVPLFDSEGDYVYFKSVDANGVPLPLVTKVISDPPIEVKVEEIKVDTNDYVTKQSYDELKRKYDDLETRILELETKPTYTSTFTGNTFNNSRKGGKDNVN